MTDQMADAGMREESEAVLAAVRAAGHDAAMARAVKPEGCPDGIRTQVIVVAGGGSAARTVAEALRRADGGREGLVELVVRDAEGVEGGRVALIARDADVAEGEPRDYLCGFGGMRPGMRAYRAMEGMILPPVLDLRPLREDRSGGAPRGPGAKGARKRQR